MFLLPLMAALAVVFNFPPSCVYSVVRCIVRHKRDKAAAVALRAMKYNDIRRTR
jgi:hypothetical protein